MKLSFTKMHGAGNDFVVIDATRRRFQPTPRLLHRLTDRRFGVGCDQVLVVEAPGAPDVDFDYRIFNADGSEVGQCGNGSRCLARFVADEGLSSKPRLRVRTTTSVLELERRDDGHVTVNMGVPRLEPHDIPFAAASRRPTYALEANGERVEFGACSMGNPHLVMAVPDVDAAPVDVLGPALERHPAFPERVNVGFAHYESTDHLRLRVWERGVGETLACGSGACAAVVVGQLQGRCGPHVTVQVRGGHLVIEWAGEGHPVRMTGPARTVFKGELEWTEK